MMHMNPAVSPYPAGWRLSAMGQNPSRPLALPPEYFKVHRKVDGRGDVESRHVGDILVKPGGDEETKTATTADKPEGRGRPLRPSFSRRSASRSSARPASDNSPPVSSSLDYGQLGGGCLSPGRL